MNAQSAAPLANEAMNISSAQAFAMPEIEDASFETIMPGGSAIDAHAEVAATAGGFAIFTPGVSRRPTLPGFGYWLVVALAALSAFWIAGGHVLFIGQ